MSKGLKRPPMDGSAGEMRRCCQGVNYNKLYDLEDPCEDPTLELSLDNGECECIECRDSEDCWQRGYSACYVCVEGQCEPGPRCCDSLPGELFATCGQDPATIDPDRDCCVNYNNIHVWTAGTATKKHNGKIDGVYTCQEEDTGPRVFYTSKFDCEEFVVESTTSRVSGLEYNTCGCPTSEFTNTTSKLWIKSPAGGLRPSRRYCLFLDEGLAGALKAKYGEPTGPVFGGGSCVSGPCSGPIYWITGTRIVTPPFSTYYYCHVDMDPYTEEAMDTFCLGGQWPENRSCACTGLSYVEAESGERPWTSVSTCGICAGTLTWNGCDAVPVGET